MLFQTLSTSEALYTNQLLTNFLPAPCIYNYNHVKIRVSRMYALETAIMQS